MFFLSFSNEKNLVNNLSGQFFYTDGEELMLYKDFEDINKLVDFNVYKTT